MTNVNVTDLRRNLPAYLEEVRKGKRIRVTVRGTAVAELIPPVPTKSEAEAARALLKGSVRRYARPFEPAGDQHLRELDVATPGPSGPKT